MAKKHGKKKRGIIGTLLNSLLHGKVINADVFRRFPGLFILTALFFMGYIVNKFMCQSELQEINTLKTQLTRVKTDYVNASASYYSRIREAEMRHLVDSFNLGLRPPEQPPFKIEQ